MRYGLHLGKMPLIMFVCADKQTEVEAFVAGYTTFVLCKKQADALSACQVSKEGACEDEVKAFSLCSQENAHKSVTRLVSLGAQVCPSEWEVFSRCQQDMKEVGSDADSKPPPSCEQEGAAVLSCTARGIMERLSNLRDLKNGKVGDYDEDWDDDDADDYGNPK